MCLVAFDEFQEVARINAALPGVFRSELEGHGQAAAYIFSGSHPGLLRELFSDRRHAFFAQAAPVKLGPLPPDELTEYLLQRFHATDRDPGEALGPLLDTAEGHPQRAMLLAHHLYERFQPGSSADIETWADTLQAAQRETESEIQILWESCTSLQRRALKVIAQRTIPLARHQADQRYGLPKGGSHRPLSDDCTTTATSSTTTPPNELARSRPLPRQLAERKLNEVGAISESRQSRARAQHRRTAGHPARPSMQQMFEHVADFVHDSPHQRTRLFARGFRAAGPTRPAR